VGPGLRQDVGMKEAQVQEAWVRYLMDRAWDVTTSNADFTDVIARRGAELLLAEVKGHTTSPGLDVDTVYGQLLRRMKPETRDLTRYALVVPESMVGAVQRVARPVRRLIGIEVYLVSDLGQVRRFED
jgi:hypothetical protein